VNCFEVIFDSLIPKWTFRWLTSKGCFTRKNSVPTKTEFHQKGQEELPQSPNPQVADELQTKLPDAEYANGKREPTLVQPDRTAKINNKVILNRLKRKLKSVESTRDALLTENQKLSTKLIATERAHAEEIQAMKWYQEELETGFADAKLQEELKTEQALAHYRKEISQLREINSQLINENQDLGAQLVKSQNSYGSVSLCLEQREEELISLEEQVIDLKISCEDLKTVQDELTFELAQAKLEHEKSHVKYRDQISELENRNHRLSREKEDISIDLTISQINSDYLSFTLDENEMTIERLEEKLIVLQYRIIDRHRQWRGLCLKRTDLKRKNDQLHDQITVLEDQLENEVALRLEMEEVHAYELTSIRNFYSVRQSKREEEIEELLDEVDRLEDLSYELPDFYAILGFEKNNNREFVSNEEINAAYKAAQLANHPDKVNQRFSEYGPAICKRAVDRARKRSQQIERAKEILGFTRFRAPYDRWLKMTELNTIIERQKNNDEFHEREQKMKEEIRLAKQRHQ